MANFEDIMDDEFEDNYVWGEQVSDQATVTGFLRARYIRCVLLTIICLAQTLDWNRYIFGCS